MMKETVNLYQDGRFTPAVVEVEQGQLSVSSSDSAAAAGSLYLLPGFVDVHVHFREPGFSYKETIFSGSRAAAHGGYTTVATMPNLNPVPDSMIHLQEQLDIIQRDACIRVLPYGAITVGQMGEEISDMEQMADHVIAFSDDGRGVQNEDMMRQAMMRAKKLNKLIVAHCEDNSLLHGGYIHDGEYARAHGHRGICSESEWKPIERDLRLAAQTGCGYHVCHISTKESVDIIRQAKKAGVNVTCETGPHYLLLDDSCLQEDGRFKMNPPLRSRRDRDALIEGLLDGTIDMIATDHAPHSAQEKGRGLEKSAMGIVGIETAFPLLYTYLVKKGVLSLEKLVQLMSVNPARRFGLDDGMVQCGEKSTFTLWDLSAQSVVDPAGFLSMGRATPFTGWQTTGQCILTEYKGETVWSME